MSKYCFGIDIGGTTVKLGLFEKDGTLVDKWEITTHTEEEGKAILPDIAKSVTDKLQQRGLDKKDIIGIGVGAPGPITADGCINRTANLGWNKKFNLEKSLSDLTGLAVKAGNDANVAALGEMWKGGGEGAKNMVLVTLGTGVGGGIISDGKIVIGNTGSGGEIGHMHVQDGEHEVCGCGCQGCLEQYASATGVVRLAKRHLAATDKASVLRKANNISAKTVFDAVKAGDEVAVEIAEQFGNYLGSALSVIASVVDPEVIVVGGGVSRAGEVLLDYIRKYYEPNAFFAIKNVRFVLARLGNDAGMYGAAKLILE